MESTQTAFSPELLSLFRVMIPILAICGFTAITAGAYATVKP